MTEYKKKKQLLDENKDMYISEYDKNLSYDALSRIVEAKKDYAEAAKNNDKTAMTKANDIANGVRAKFGGYTAGDYGNEYRPFQYYDDDFEDYESKYEDDLDELYDIISKSKDDFSYDYEADPVYKAYKDIYETQGDLAYERALSENSLKTGGMKNSYAQSAASQALNHYNSQLAAKIPELYEAAYERHYKEQEDKEKKLKDLYDIIKNREERDYERYLDRADFYESNRDFNYKAKSDMLDSILAREKSEAELEDTTDNTKLLYDIFRDFVEDEKWRSEYNLNAHKGKYSPYRGEVGTGNLLDYARRIFNDNSLTLEDVYRILGL